MLDLAADSAESSEDEEYVPSGDEDEHEDANAQPQHHVCGIII